MRIIASALTVAAAAALLAPLPAFAQPVPGPDAVEETESAADDMARTLGNPETQERMADAMGTVSEMLLDLPLAPMARAVAQATGQDPRSVDPDLTLRQVAPGAQSAPGEVREKLPRMMGAMAGMAGGMGAMAPALREMADRMRAAVDVATRASDY